MNHAAELIRSISLLLWPIAVCGIAIFMLPTLRKILGGSESVEVEVGNAKISIQRASEDLRKLIFDLTERINALEPKGESEESQGRSYEPIRDVRRSILWVDDQPNNNVYERANLVDGNFRVVLAQSTQGAINLIRSDGPFDIIISDMSRIEEDRDINPRAGIDLLRRLRGSGNSIPIVFYSSRASLSSVIPEITTESGVRYTYSPSELMQLVEANGFNP